jgi:hypothetical protein
MKKVFLLITVVVLATELSYGQFALGFRVGYSGNKLTTNIDSVKSQFNSGLHVGIFSRIGKRFYFAPELLYTISGGMFNDKGNVSTSGWNQKITLGSMDIPLLVGFKIIHTKFISWRVVLGPEASFVINKKIKDAETITGPITKSDINTANWFILAGTGIDVLFFSLDVRYQYGLNQMIKDAGNYSFNTNNSLIAVSLGIKIFGKK